jgi:hypothetical protein
MWRPALEPGPVPVRLALPKAEHLRHRRKYAKGNLGTDKSFYFRGPEGRLKLRAQNLQLFVQIAEGVDDETWLFHLRNGDYARWFRNDIKDQDLADTATWVAQRPDIGADESRSLISAAISERYTAHE